MSSTSAGDQLAPDIAMSHAGDYVVVWHGAGVSGSDIFGQRVADDGAMSGAEFPVNTSTLGGQFNAEASMSADGWFVVVWEDQQTNQIKVRRYDDTGTPDTGEIVVILGGHNADIAMRDDHGFLVVWETNTAVTYQRYDINAAPVGGPLQVGTGTNVIFPRISVAQNGAFGVAWHAENPADVFMRMFGSNELPIAAAVRVNNTLSNNQTSPDVGMADDGRFVVAWQSFDQLNQGFEVYLQSYAANGAPSFAAEQLVNTDSTSLYQWQPGLGMNGAGAFAIGFATEQFSFAEDIIRTLYDANHVRVGSELQANVFLGVNSDQLTPRTAMADDGSFVTVWQSAFQDGDGWGIYGQRYDAAGNPLGSTN